MLERTVKCDCCQEKFIQKWVVPQKSWSKINQVEYWSGGRKWETYNLVCRSCWKNLYENDRERFNYLIDPKKRKSFVNYNGYGVFDKSDRPRS